MSSGKRRFAVRPGDGLVVEGAGLQATVQDADKPVGEPIAGRHCVRFCIAEVVVKDTATGSALSMRTQSLPGAQPAHTAGVLVPGTSRVPCIEAGLPYHGGLLGAHMQDPYATRPGEVGTVIGEWLGARPSTPTHQIHLCGRTDAEVDLVPGSKGHGL